MTGMIHSEKLSKKVAECHDIKMISKFRQLSNWDQMFLARMHKEHTFTKTQANIIRMIWNQMFNGID
jgi:6-pyruvoyl-tetrahydropterin synthase